MNKIILSFNKVFQLSRESPISCRNLYVTLQLTVTDDGSSGRIKAKMANNGPLKDLECFKPHLTRQSELGELLRVLEEGLQYDEECTITAKDMEMELETDKIVERDIHLCEMNQKLRDKLTNRIETIRGVLDKDYEELMEDIKNKTKKGK